jgi:hypothetical protein
MAFPAETVVVTRVGRRFAPDPDWLYDEVALLSVSPIDFASTNQFFSIGVPTNDVGNDEGKSISKMAPSI